MAGVLTVEQDVWTRHILKGDVKYPVIPKQKEYMIVDHAYAVNVTQNGLAQEMSSKFYLPDNGTILGISLMISVGTGAGEDLHCFNKAWLFLSEAELMMRIYGIHQLSALGEKVWKARAWFESGIFIPFDDDDYFSVLLAHEGTSSATPSISVNTYIKCIKED